jgi:hypothetical protein
MDQGWFNNFWLYLFFASVVSSTVEKDVQESWRECMVKLGGNVFCHVGRDLYREWRKSLGS